MEGRHGIMPMECGMTHFSTQQQSLCGVFSRIIKQGHCDIYYAGAETVFRNEVHEEDEEFLQTFAEEDLRDFDVKTDDHILTSSGRFALRRYITNLMEFMNMDSPTALNTKIAAPLQEMIGFFDDSHEKAIQAMCDEQEALADDHDNASKLSAEQKDYMNNEVLTKNLTPTLGLIVASEIGYHREVASESWNFAGKSRMMKQFCLTLLACLRAESPQSMLLQERSRLLKTYGPSSKADDSSSDDSDSSEDETHKSSSGGGKDAQGGKLSRGDSNVLMACLFMQYACELFKKENPSNFSIALMKGPWFDEGVRLYNSHFDEFGCETKISIDLANALRNKIDSSGWLRHIISKPKQDNKDESFLVEVEDALKMPVETLREQFIKETHRTFPCKQRTHNKWVMILSTLIKQKKIRPPKTSKKKSRPSGKSSSANDRKKKRLFVASEAVSKQDTSSEEE